MTLFSINWIFVEFLSFFGINYFICEGNWNFNHCISQRFCLAVYSENVTTTKRLFLFEIFFEHGWKQDQETWLRRTQILIPLSPYQFRLISIHFHELQYISSNFNTFQEVFSDFNNCQRSPKIVEVCQRSPKIAEDHQRSPKINKDRRRSPKIAQDH